jgi:predicted SAM-dependent methyltransferase
MSIASNIKRQLPAGVGRALSTLRQEIAIALRHQRGVKAARKYAGQRSLKLNVGCGNNAKPGWVNIDLADEVDLQLDLREPIPLPDGRAVIVYSEHFFEHLDYPTDALVFLRESFRLLEPDGRFSVGVPDTRWPLYCYVGQDEGWVEATIQYHWHPAWCRTTMEHINYHFRQDGQHKFAWDFETMEQVLRDVGFVRIKQRNYSPEIDRAARAIGTLYVDAFVPS